jgi:hypothetical protein
MKEATSLEKEPSLFSIGERSVMEKGIWTLIIPSAPATSQRGYRWAGRVREEVWNACETLAEKRRVRE